MESRLQFWRRLVQEETSLGHNTTQSLVANLQFLLFSTTLWRRSKDTAGLSLGKREASIQKFTGVKFEVVESSTPPLLLQYQIIINGPIHSKKPLVNFFLHLLEKTNLIDPNNVGIL